MIDFKKLKADRVGSRYSASKAPHKAVLLLAVIKLYENRKIDLKKINFKNVYLIETYKDIWKCLDYDKPGPISNPLFHLKSDGFYTPHFTIEKPTKPGGSFKKLLEQAESAEFSDEFIELIQDEDSRKKVISDILTGGYFSIDEISKLNAKLQFLDKTFDYEKEISADTEEVFDMKEDKYKRKEDDEVRSSAFRRIILDTYDSTCAVCGISLLVENISIIEAAHILPYHKFHIDDPRIGISLCRIHHWLFDHGGISVSPDYRIKISNNIIREEPEGILSRYFRKKIVLPKNEKLYPAKDALIWHNREWGFI